MSNSNPFRSADSDSDGGSPWWLWILAIIGTFVIARVAFGLVWAMLPLLLVALVVYGGYRMLSSDSDKSAQLSSPDSSHNTQRAHRTTVSRSSGAMRDDAALDSLKQRMGQQNSAASDDSDRMRRKEAELDDFDRRMAEIDAELGDLEDDDHL